MLVLLAGSWRLVAGMCMLCLFVIVAYVGFCFCILIAGVDVDGCFCVIVGCRLLVLFVCYVALAIVSSWDRCVFVCVVFEWWCVVVVFRVF